MVSRFVVRGLSVALLFGGATWFLVSRPPIAVEAVDHLAVEDRALREAEDAALFQACQTRINAILREKRRTNLNGDRAHELRMARGFLQCFVHRYTRDHRLSMQVNLAVGHRELGVANLLLWDLSQSESSIRESLRICRSIRDYVGEPDLQVLQAVNEGSLGWILAMTGRLGEAEGLTNSSIRSWEDLVRRVPHDASLKSDLAAYQRNLSMIHHAGGGDGLPNALASVNTALEAMAATTEAIKVDTSPESMERRDRVSRYETLIDSEQYLGMLYWQQGQLAEAQQICRSSINHLNELLQKIESSFETSLHIPQTERYCEALVRAQRNLDLLSQNAGEDSLHTVAVGVLTPESEPGSWDWKLLNLLPGQILTMDFVIRGNRFPGEFEQQEALLPTWQHEWSRVAVTSRNWPGIRNSGIVTASPVFSVEAPAAISE